MTRYDDLAAAETARAVIAETDMDHYLPTVDLLTADGAEWLWDTHDPNMVVLVKDGTAFLAVSTDSGYGFGEVLETAAWFEVA